MGISRLDSPTVDDGVFVSLKPAAATVDTQFSFSVQRAQGWEMVF